MFQKAMDMLEYGYGRVRQFPKSERHVLAADIRREMTALEWILSDAVFGQPR